MYADGHIVVYSRHVGVVYLAVACIVLLSHHGQVLHLHPVCPLDVVRADVFLYALHNLLGEALCGQLGEAVAHAPQHIDVGCLSLGKFQRNVGWLVVLCISQYLYAYVLFPVALCHDVLIGFAEYLLCLVLKGACRCLHATQIFVVCRHDSVFPEHELPVQPRVLAVGSCRYLLQHVVKGAQGRGEHALVPWQLVVFLLVSLVHALHLLAGCVHVVYGLGDKLLSALELFLHLALKVCASRCDGLFKRIGKGLHGIKGCLSSFSHLGFQSGNLLLQSLSLLPVFLTLVLGCVAVMQGNPVCAQFRLLASEQCFYCGGILIAGVYGHHLSLQCQGGHQFCRLFLGADAVVYLLGQFFYLLVYGLLCVGGVGSKLPAQFRFQLLYLCLVGINLFLLLLTEVA